MYIKARRDMGDIVLSRTLNLDQIRLQGTHDKHCECGTGHFDRDYSW